MAADFLQRALPVPYFLHQFDTSPANLQALISMAAGGEGDCQREEGGSPRDQPEGGGTASEVFTSNIGAGFQHLRWGCST